jgi:hypothetical protein
MLTVVSVIKCKCSLNFLLLATLAGIDKLLSGYKRKGRCNETDASEGSEAC